ncbi:hypothetical protein CHUAL_001665 [Chamberlinius hualienensis]
MVIVCSLQHNDDRLEKDEINYIVTGVKNGTAELPCNVSLPHMRPTIAIVLWYKDSQGVPIYSVDFRGKHRNNGSHINDNILQSRANFYHREEPGFLLIKPVQPEDAGVYRCRVDFVKAPTRNQRVRLNVIEPPESVTIIDGHGMEVSDTVSSKEGSTLSLTCQTSSGIPVPTVTWWRGSSLLPPSFTITPNGTVKNELVIHSLSRKDLHAKFTCQASNNNISLPAIKVVILELIREYLFI